MSGDAFERGYVQGYRAALGAAAAECRRHAEALDHSGNAYTRYGDAIRLSCAVLALSVPAINEGVIRDEKTGVALARCGAAP